MRVWWLSLKITLQQFTFFVEFGPQNPVTQFQKESETTSGVIMEGTSRRSNFIKNVWPSDQHIKGWTILLPANWIDSMYLVVV